MRRLDPTWRVEIPELTWTLEEITKRDNRDTILSAKRSIHVRLHLSLAYFDVEWSSVRKKTNKQNATSLFWHWKRPNIYLFTFESSWRCHVFSRSYFSLILLKIISFFTPSLDAPLKHIVCQRRPWALRPQKRRWQTICFKKRGRKWTCQHWRQRWRIDTTTRKLYTKTRWRTDYTNQKH